MKLFIDLILLFKNLFQQRQYIEVHKNYLKYKNIKIIECNDASKINQLTILIKSIEIAHEHGAIWRRF